MATSQDINYALISALYANQDSGFYNDVYFPIIKYTIVQLFNSRDAQNSELYFSAQKVQEYISENFKIFIPDMVITKSIEKISKTHKDFMEISLMERGDYFQIKNIWDSTIYDNISERQAYFSEGLKQIEEDYQLYLKKQGTYDDNVSFLKFISDNTEEIIGYFQDLDSSIIDEKYTSVVFFLESLNNNKSKKREFEIANQLFWASIIAGYLKSEKEHINASEGNSMKVYFLDTAILLGMLDLSSSKKEKYAKEIRDIIKSSGGAMKVHPLTIEEIKNILNSVENSQSPEPGTDIAEAWENHKLSIVSIARTRVHLENILAEQGVQKFPILGPDACNAIIKKYEKLNIVAELANERSVNNKNNRDNFREVHDIFMADFIKERRKISHQLDSPVFVTANRDLISFINKMYPEQYYMISTGKLILELWMHNTKPADISNCALTETMARCLDLHNTRVKAKINEVSRYFNQEKGQFDNEVYKDFIKKLYRRAKNVIMTVENDPDNQDTIGEISGQRILDALKADKDYEDSIIQELDEKLHQSEKTNETLNIKDTNNSKTIKELAIKSDKLASKLSEKQDELANERLKLGEAERIITLFKERKKISTELSQVVNDLKPWENAREKSFSNLWVIIGIILGWLLILGALFIGVSISKLLNLSTGIMLPVGIFLASYCSNLNTHKDDRKKDAYHKWEKKLKNQQYSNLLKQKEDLNNRLNEIDNEIKIAQN